MNIRALEFLVWSVALAAVIALALLPRDGTLEQPIALALLMALAVVAGAKPACFSPRGNELSATHLVVLCTLAACGVIPAVLTAIGGLTASLLTQRRSPLPLRLVFNLGDLVLSTVAAWIVFVALGGRAGADEIGKLLAALLGATAAYYVVNTGLIAAAVSLERGQPLFGTWRKSFLWTVASYLSAVTVAFAMLVALDRIGVLGIALGLPPILLVKSFYRKHRNVMDEKQHRIEAVERLIGALRDKVEEQRKALEHIERLQGLLPICMHCKSVRDDQDTWRRIESYLAEHSPLRFTHSLCGTCRAEHYPEVPGQPTETAAS